MVIARGITQGLHRIDQEISMELGYIAFYDCRVGCPRVPQGLQLIVDMSTHQTTHRTMSDVRISTKM